MSLVNDMLRDLDQRRQPGNGTQSNVDQMSPVRAPSQRKRQALWIWVLLLAVAVLIGFYLLQPQWRALLSNTEQSSAPEVHSKVPVFKTVSTSTNTTPSKVIVEGDVFWPEQNDSPETEMVVTVKSAAAIPPETVDVNPVIKTESVQITGAYWESLGKGHKLILETSQSPLFNISELTNQLLQLEIRQANLTHPLPPLPSEFIQSSRFSKGRDQLVLTLTTDRKSRFQVYSLGNEKGFSLVIELQPSQRQTLEASQQNVFPQLPKSKPVSSESPSLKPASHVAKAVVPVQSIQRQTAASTPASVSAAMKTPKKLMLGQADRKQVEKASALIRKGLAEEAEKLLSKTLINQPAAVESRQLLASLLLSQGRLKQASAILEKGLIEDPENQGLRKVRARILMRNSKHAEAVKLLQFSMPELAADPQYHQLRAAALQGGKQYEEASSVYYQLLRQDSTQASWWLGLAISLEALEKRQQAFQAYKNVLQIPGAALPLSEYAQQRIRLIGQ
ncbi:lipopolysaccharide assembly protein LapB [Motiliproteus sp. MSK22-1]|uniref:tetratricopeptide repeat protein n=1 Tax=Motiliproteus sp. MSK22-1 TaxID=1897630 RepID=UPI0009789509|nr:tetratricopeptide repeat protein [Motiliproteus sp. MSK22-1]OMH39530.1 hypothetical protein BGP75_02765 [Motiliproteus sp. MSK22-1]